MVALEKLKILWSFTHPQVVSNLYDGNQTVVYSDWLHKKKKYFILWKSMATVNSWVSNFLQNILLCAQQKDKKSN